VLIGAIPPVMLKSDKNPGGLPMSVFDELRAGVESNRAQFFRDLSLPFYGYNKPDAKPSGAVRDAFFDQGMQSSIIASYDCIKAFSETDLTEDLKKIEVPTLVLHGDADQIVPIADSAYLSSKIVKNATLKVIPGAPHGNAQHMQIKLTPNYSPFFRPEERRGKMNCFAPLIEWEATSEAISSTGGLADPLVLKVVGSGVVPQSVGVVRVRCGIVLTDLADNRIIILLRLLHLRKRIREEESDRYKRNGEF
jgi:hypothetical protein